MNVSLSLSNKADTNKVHSLLIGWRPDKQLQKASCPDGKLLVAQLNKLKFTNMLQCSVCHLQSEEVKTQKPPLYMLPWTDTKCTLTCAHCSISPQHFSKATYCFGQFYLYPVKMKTKAELKAERHSFAHRGKKVFFWWLINEKAFGLSSQAK